jgi:cellulose synthase/poly-beta-1,6-N-acetylglucosamine synthase-like glycosyltransferase
MAPNPQANVPFRPRRKDARDADVVPFRPTLVPEPEAPAPVAAGPAFRRAPYARRRRIGEVLVEIGAITPPLLARALMIQRRRSCRLGDVLVGQGMLSDAELAEALGRQYGLRPAGPAPVGCPASDALARTVPADKALRLRALPWRRVGTLTLIATADPRGLDALRAELPAELGPCLFASVSNAELDARIGAVHGTALARAAECRAPEGQSCRRWRDRSGALGPSVVVMTLILLIALFPAAAVRFFTVVALAVVVANVSLRVAALIAIRRSRTPSFASTRPHVAGERRLPTISVMVPLHNEPDIAGALTERLSRLDYPRELLEVALVVEQGDRATLDALARADLPPWMRVVEVPDGHPRTKPRAMNYALDFLKGDIVGIYDAEDAPARDQLRAVAARFDAAPARVACLQGRLDFYNPTRNWMARCFTIEYATWFRLVLPGIARMGMVIPLGGTTLFFRRAALERVGGWDAHNVTEDADLGVRLARRGYRTEIIETTTLEEANAAPLAWIKQRSRWMKGYVLTWAVHSRRPRTLWRDLGPWRFFGFQLLFLGSILNAVLLPFVWAPMIMLVGLPHPLAAWLPSWGPEALGGAMGVGTVLCLALNAAACQAPHHRRLWPWVPTVLAYFPLASLAMAKALFEIVLKPFHWDKTIHGAHGGDAPGSEIAALEERTRRPGAAASPGEERCG